MPLSVKLDLVGQLQSQAAAHGQQQLYFAAQQRFVSYFFPLVRGFERKSVDNEKHA